MPLAKSLMRNKDETGEEFCMKIKIHRPLPAGPTEDELSALLSAAG